MLLLAACNREKVTKEYAAIQLDSVKKLESSSGGEKKAVLGEYKEFLEKALAFDKSWQKKNKAYIDPKLMDYANMKSASEIERQLDIVRDFSRANEEYYFLIRDFQQKMDEHYAKATDKELKDFLDRHYFKETKGNYASIGQILDKYRDNCVASLGMLNLLLKSWGRWEYSIKNKAIVFNDAKDIEEYRAFYSKLNTSAQQIDELSSARNSALKKK